MVLVPGEKKDTPLGWPKCRSQRTEILAGNRNVRQTFFVKSLENTPHFELEFSWCY